MEQDWETLERVFSEALEFPAEERRRFIKQHSGDNLWLRQELEACWRFRKPGTKRLSIRTREPYRNCRRRSIANLDSK
jgi:hypothetical protein